MCSVEWKVESLVVYLGFSTVDDWVDRLGVMMAPQKDGMMVVMKDMLKVASMV